MVGAVFVFQALGFHPGDTQFQVVSHCAVDQRFLQRLVRILVLHILADDGNIHIVLGVVNPVNKFFPLLQVSLFRFQVQVLQRQCIHAFVREHQRHFVDGSNVFRRNNRFLFDVAEERDLRFQFF